MRNLLIINPNTSNAITDLLQQRVQSAFGPDVRIRAVTARFGAPYISDEAAYAVAAHATLDAWACEIAQQEKSPDAVLIGCFGDPGLMALRESSSVPVSGLAEAAFDAAARHGRFAVVTGGERWIPMLQRLAHTLGHGKALADICAVAPSGAQLAADPVAALQLLSAACVETLRRSQVDAVILGGAGLAGMAALVQPRIDAPIIDSVDAGASWFARLPEHAPRRAVSGFDVAWKNLSAEMTALGTKSENYE